MAVTLRGSLRRTFQSILVWCVVSGALAVAGGLTRGAPRGVLWLLAVTVDVIGSLAGFYTPGLGKSRTRDWDIAAEHPSGTETAAFVVAFTGSLALWWLYFDRFADAGTDVIATSEDPSRLGRSAYTMIHPIMVAGIIVSAAGDEKILSEPSRTATTASAWMILGGPPFSSPGTPPSRRWCGGWCRGRGCPGSWCWRCSRWRLGRSRRSP
jgi:low temperature requirement protein LtrA